MADPYVVVRDTIKKLRNDVAQFDDTLVTTDHHDIWSCRKIIALYLYIKPYLQTMRNNGFKKIHFVDLFAGSGLIRVNDKVMPGTPLIPLIRKKEGFEFDSYYFSDLSKNYTDSLSQRVSKLNEGNNVNVEKSEFSKAVNKIFSGKWPKYSYKENAYLVMLDPFGMEISWESVQRILGSGSVDLLITFMTWGFQRNRNISRSAESMTRVFGNENWKDCDDFAELYRRQIESLRLGNIRPYQTTVLAVETNVGNTYHLIFVSTSKQGAHGPFSWIQKHLDEVNKKLLNDAFRGGTTEGADLDSYM